MTKATQASDASPRLAYLICAAPRCGTTLLCRVLADIGVAGRPDEYFLAEDPAKLPDWKFWEAGPFGVALGARSRAEYLQLVYKRGSTSNGVFGAKIMWHNLPWAISKFSEMPPFKGLDRAALLRKAFPNLRLIHVVREDRIRQAVSWARMALDGVWVVSETEPASAGSVPEYDFSLINNLERAILAAEIGWCDLAAELGLPLLKLVYETDLAARDALPRTLNKVMAHLDLPALDSAAPEPRTARQGDSLNDEWVQRYIDDQSGTTHHAV